MLVNHHNAILNQERVIVSDIEGTNRDAIDTDFIRDDKDMLLIHWFKKKRTNIRSNR